MDGPRACLPEEEIEIDNLINAIFRKGTGQDVRTDYPLVYNPKMLPNRRIIKLDDKIVSHVPVIARESISENDNFTIAIISTTLTHPDYRKQGLATRCLMDCVRVMDEMQWPISVLWTMESTFPFYQNSGWEAVSSQGLAYDISNKESHLFHSGPFEIIPYCSNERNHIKSIRSMHNAESSHIKRSFTQHNALFSPPLMNTLLAMSEDKAVAYLTYSHSINKPGVIEAGGDLGGIETLLQHVLHEKYFDCDTQVIVPLTPNGLQQVLEAAKPGSAKPIEKASGVGFQMHRINSLEKFLISIIGHLRKRSINMSGEICLVCADSGETVSLNFDNGSVSISLDPLPTKLVLTRKQLTQLIFGSHHSLPPLSLNPSDRMILDRIFPYYFPVWELDHC